MAQIKITLVKSKIGSNKSQVSTLKALGLNKTNSSVVQHHNGKNRSDRAKRYHTEVVVTRITLRRNCRHTDTERHNKGNGHRACGYPARIKGNRKKSARCKKRQNEYDQIKVLVCPEGKLYPS